MQVDWESLEDLEAEIMAVPEPRPIAYRGALVGTAELVACVPADLAPASQAAWTVGPWCFVLEDVRPLTDPIPYRGSLGLFRVHLTM